MQRLLMHTESTHVGVEKSSGVDWDEGWQTYVSSSPVIILKLQIASPATNEERLMAMAVIS